MVGAHGEEPMHRVRGLHVNECNRRMLLLTCGAAKVHCLPHGPAARALHVLRHVCAVAATQLLVPVCPKRLARRVHNGRMHRLGRRIHLQHPLLQYMQWFAAWHRGHDSQYYSMHGSFMITCSAASQHRLPCA